MSELSSSIDGLDCSSIDYSEELGQISAHLQHIGAHIYDVQAVIVYQGRGQVGHYLAYVRQSDGAFLGFDDEAVVEYAGTKDHENRKPANENLCEQKASDLSNACHISMRACWDKPCLHV